MPSMQGGSSWEPTIPSYSKKKWDITPPGSRVVELQKKMLAEQTQALNEAIIAPLQAEITKLNTASTHVNALLQTFKTLSTAVNSLTSFSTWVPYTFQSTQSDGAVTITPTASATEDTVGDISVNVTSIAKADQIVSSSFASATSALSLSGNLVLNGGTPIAIIASDTLNTIASKIQQQSDLNAWVTQVDTNNFVLSISHPSLCVPIDGSTSDAGIWSGLQLPATTSLSTLQANLSVNGVSGIRRSTNTITDIKPGVQLVLNKPSTENTLGSLINNTSWFNDKLTTFISAYNTCQQALEAERASDPSNPGQPAAGAVLGQFSTFSFIEQNARIPIMSFSEDYPTSFASLGYKLEDGQLVADSTYTNTSLIMQDYINFCRTTYTSTSSDFTLTLPTIFDRTEQSNLHNLNGHSVVVTIIHNVDDTYSATLSCNDFDNVTVEYDATEKTIIGTDAYKGLYLLYGGADIPLEGSATTTIALRSGIADEFYRVLDRMIVAPNTQTPCLFDQLSGEVQSQKNVTQKSIDTQTKMLEEKASRITQKAGELAALETKQKGAEKLIKGAVYGHRSRDE